MTHQEKIDCCLEASEARLLSMNTWEEYFIDSLSIQISGGKELSWKQSKKLNDIWGRVEWIL